MSDRKMSILPFGSDPTGVSSLSKKGAVTQGERRCRSLLLSCPVSCPRAIKMKVAQAALGAQN